MNETQTEFDQEETPQYLDPLAEEIAEFYREGHGAFAIENENTANWALRKIANWEAEKARIRAQAEAMIGAIERRQQGFEAHFLPQLEAWARMQLAGGKTKTLRLLQGTIAFRRVPAGVKITDQEAAINYAKATELGVVTIVEVEKFDSAAYRKLALEAMKTEERMDEATGEVLMGAAWPGLEAVPERESMLIKTEEGGK